MVLALSLMFSLKCSIWWNNFEAAVLCLDWFTQVRMLLKELEEARGTVVRMSADGDDDDDDSEVTSSSHLISEKLVSFRYFYLKILSMYGYFVWALLV